MTGDPDGRWDERRREKAARLRQAAPVVDGKVVATGDVDSLLRAVVARGDIVCLEGDNQKQANFLAAALARLDPAQVSGLHMVMSCVTLPDHIALFRKGIAARLDFAYSGPQSAQMAQLVGSGGIEVGAVHTYNELYARYFVDLTPRVALVTAQAGDSHGNLYTGPNTEETPAIVEATAFHDGIVVAQVDELSESVPRVDIPGDWVDFVVAASHPAPVTPLFTRDPAAVTEVQILIAMLAITGIYERYEVATLNHGVGFNTAAVELLLPTYGEQRGLRGRVCRRFMLNPHPTLIPAIEAGWVESVFGPGGEVGMERYTSARPDVFFCGRDGSLRSNRPLAQLAGHYAVDMFIGSTLQVDVHGNSSTVTKDRITGFGGAPNMGCQPTGRRHPSPAWLKAGAESATRGPGSLPGRKLVVQMVETFQAGGRPTFVEELEAADPSIVAAMGGVAPVMIYGDDVTHVVTEEGVANLGACRDDGEREAAIRAIAGYTPAGLAASRSEGEDLRDRRIVQRPADLGVDPADATRDLLAARSIKDLVRISGGLYDPPPHFVDW